MKHAALLAFTLVACVPTSRHPRARATPQPAPPPVVEVTPPAPPPLAVIHDECPLAVRGAKVAAVDIDDGGELVFEAVGDVTELRVEVAALTHRLDQVSPEIAIAGDDTADADDKLYAGRIPDSARRDDRDKVTLVDVPATVRVAPAPGGARMIFTTDPSHLSTLRLQLQVRARLLTDACAPRE